MNRQTLYQRFTSPFLLLALVMTLALILRLPLLNSSLWLDEAAQALESARPLAEQLDIIPDFQPPLLHLLVHAAIQVSRQEWWLRIIGALLPGLATIAGCYQLGKKLFSHKTGLLAALLLATSSFHIFYSQELRPYSLPAMLAVLSWLSLLNLISYSNKAQTSHSTNNATLFTNSATFLKMIMPSLAYIILTSAGLYSSYLYPFLLLSQVVYVFLFHSSALKSFLLATGSSFLLFLPWLPTFFKQLATGQSLRSKLPGWEGVVSLSQFKSLPLTLGKFVFGVIDLDLNLTFIFFGLLVVTGVSLLLQRRLQLKLSFWQKDNRRLQQDRQQQHLLLILLWLLVPLISAWLVSFLVPVVRPKRVLYLLPAWHLLLAELITDSFIFETQSTNSHSAQTPSASHSPATKNFLTTLQTSKIALVLLALQLTLNCFSTFSYWTNPRYQREDWRGLQAAISARLPAQDTVALFSFPEPFSAWRWYNKQQIPSLSTNSYYLPKTDDLLSRIKPINQYQFVLVFDYLRDLTDPNDQLTQAVTAYGYQEIGVISRPNIGQVHIYSQQKLLSKNLQHLTTPEPINFRNSAHD